MASIVSFSCVYCFHLLHNGHSSISSVPFVSRDVRKSPLTLLWGREKEGKISGAFCLYVVALSEVAKNGGISSNSYGSLEEPV